MGTALSGPVQPPSAGSELTTNDSTIPMTAETSDNPKIRDTAAAETPAQPANMTTGKPGAMPTQAITRTTPTDIPSNDQASTPESEANTAAHLSENTSPETPAEANEAGGNIYTSPSSDTPAKSDPTATPKSAPDHRAASTTAPSSPDPQPDRSNDPDPDPAEPDMPSRDLDLHPPASEATATATATATAADDRALAQLQLPKKPEPEPAHPTATEGPSDAAASPVGGSAIGQATTTRASGTTQVDQSVSGSLGSGTAGPVTGSSDASVSADEGSRQTGENRVAASTVGASTAEDITAQAHTKTSTVHTSAQDSTAPDPTPTPRPRLSGRGRPPPSRGPRASLPSAPSAPSAPEGWTSAQVPARSVSHTLARAIRESDPLAWMDAYDASASASAEAEAEEEEEESAKTEVTGQTKLTRSMRKSDAHDAARNTTGEEAAPTESAESDHTRAGQDSDPLAWMDAYDASAECPSEDTTGAEAAESTVTVTAAEVVPPEIDDEWTLYVREQLGRIFPDMYAAQGGDVELRHGHSTGGEDHEHERQHSPGPGDEEATPSFRADIASLRSELTFLRGLIAEMTSEARRAQGQGQGQVAAQGRVNEQPQVEGGVNEPPSVDTSPRGEGGSEAVPVAVEALSPAVVALALDVVRALDEAHNGKRSDAVVFEEDNLSALRRGIRPNL